MRATSAAHLFHLQKEVETAVVALDVAAQNSEAAQTSIRDLDEALRLASNTSSGISQNPEGALKSVSKVNSLMLTLLGS